MAKKFDEELATPLSEAQILFEEARKRGITVPKDLEEELHIREALERDLLPWPTLKDYASYVNPTILNFEHIHVLCDAAQLVVEGLITNLLVCMPTRYMKTETFARLLLSYYMHRFPNRHGAIASYNARRAWQTNEETKSHYLLSHGKTRKGAEGKEIWGPPEGGSVWAVGVGEEIGGFGYHLGVVDDPVGPEQAMSQVYQQRFARWFPAKFLQRRNWGADSSTIVVMQRVGTEDPVDWLFRREVGENTEKAPMNWHVLVMDELKSDEPLGRWDGEQGLPPTCTLIPDEREVGEVLSPSLFSKEQVLRMHADSGPFVVAAQRQQRPFRPAGDFWQESWLRIYNKLPADAYNGGKDWDTAYTDDRKNAASAWIESYRGPVGPDGRFFVYIEDFWVEWLKFPELVKIMQTVPGPHYVEQKASGKSLAQVLKANNVITTEVPVKGSKLERASAVQPQVAVGRVYVNADIRDLLLYGEQGLMSVTAEAMMSSTGGLDLNDVFVQALHRHFGVDEKDKRKYVNVFKTRG